jgi:hypothetical protein
MRIALRQPPTLLPAAQAFLTDVASASVITADLPRHAADPAEVRELAGAAATRLSAFVVRDRPGVGTLSPAHYAAVLAEAGMTSIVELSCRHRNRVALEGEIAALADIGVGGVLAVSGREPGASDPVGTHDVFDLDAAALAALAADAGHLVLTLDDEVPPGQPQIATVSIRAVTGVTEAARRAELARRAPGVAGVHLRPVAGPDDPAGSRAAAMVPDVAAALGDGAT